MNKPAVHPRRDRLRRLLTFTVVLTLVTLGWLGWSSVQGYRFVTVKLPKISRLEELRGQIVHLDEVLTMSARMATATGDSQWEARYRRFEPQLDRALKEITRLMAETAPSQTTVQTDVANAKLVAMENSAFELVRQGRRADAQQLLTSTEYEAQKRIYSFGMAEFSRSLKQTISSVRAQRQIQVLWSVVTTAISTPLLVLGWWLVLRAGRRWQTAVAQSNEQLNRQTAELQEFSRQLDERVSERTKQLKESELATLNMMDDAVRDREKVEQAYEELKREVAERRKLEEQFREQASLLDKARDAILVRDLGHRIAYWNKSAGRLYGWTANEAIGRSEAELLYKDPAAFQQACQQVIQTGEWVGELQQIGKDGTDRTVEGRWTLVRDAAGKPQSILSINTDITEKKQLAAMFLRAQRLESIGTLAGGVAHDLNNALSPILMGIQLLRIRYPDATEMIHSMELSATRGAAMVRQLLTFAKGTKGERMLVQPRHLLKEMEKFIKGTFPKNIALRVNFAKECRTILGDATQLHQVLLNLCVNARDAMPNGGTLTLEAENVEIDATCASAVPAAKPGRYVVCSVTDTGTGIPPEVLERIFEPFFSTKGPDKGTGLGLSTVMGIVKGHGGFVQVYSASKEGSTFAVYLPADHAGVDDSREMMKTQIMFRGHGETILVVDDEAPVCEIMRAVLQALNFKVLIAADGAEALMQVAENRADLSAVITDLHMPHMDGLSFVRVLRHMLPEAGIIVASGHIKEQEAKEFKELGVNAMLDKPFTEQTLVAALKKVFAR